MSLYSNRPVTYGKDMNKFPLGVVVEVVTSDEKTIGHIVGFAYNSVNEVILKVKIPDDEAGEAVILRHPTQVELF
jgi:hypothetical protein